MFKNENLITVNRDSIIEISCSCPSCIHMYQALVVLFSLIALTNVALTGTQTAVITILPTILSSVLVFISFGILYQATSVVDAAATAASSVAIVSATQPVTATVPYYSSIPGIAPAANSLQYNGLPVANQMRPPAFNLRPDRAVLRWNPRQSFVNNGLQFLRPLSSA
jgi:hypothetical protein